MAAALWIVRKLTDNKADIIDGIEVVVINNDNLDSEAVTITGAEAALVAAGHAIPTGYFDTAVLGLAATQLDTDQDLIAMGPSIDIIA